MIMIVVVVSVEETTGKLTALITRITVAFKLVVVKLSRTRVQEGRPFITKV